MEMIYLDERGPGRNERPADHDYKMPTLVADVEALRESSDFHNFRSWDTASAEASHFNMQLTLRSMYKSSSSRGSVRSTEDVGSLKNTE